MKILADSGSTKTDWALMRDNVVERYFCTSGLNPVVMGVERFEEVIRTELSDFIRGVEISRVEFYGAGCTREMAPLVRDVLTKLMPTATDIVVESDLMGACRAVCGEDVGIVAILGTGSNSCLYDGEKIVENVPSLGYVLGDEGSGAALGKMFLNALLRGQLPLRVSTAFEREFSLSRADILYNVYQNECANWFLANFAPFVRSWSKEESVRKLIVENFRAFFTKNIYQYGRRDLSVYCVGGMAYHFADCLLEVAEAEGFHIRKILRSPIDNLQYGD